MSVIEQVASRAGKSVGADRVLSLTMTGQESIELADYIVSLQVALANAEQLLRGSDLWTEYQEFMNGEED